MMIIFLSNTMLKSSCYQFIVYESLSNRYKELAKIQGQNNFPKVIFFTDMALKKKNICIFNLRSVRFFLVLLFSQNIWR